MIAAILFLSWALGAVLIGWAWYANVPPREFVGRDGDWAVSVALLWPVTLPLWCVVVGVATFLGFARWREGA